MPQLSVCSCDGRSAANERFTTPVTQQTLAALTMATSPQVQLFSTVVSITLLIPFLILRVLLLIPFLSLYITNAFGRITGLNRLPRDAYWNSLFTWEMYKHVRHSLLMDNFKPVSLGGRAENPKLISTDGKTQCHLLDLAQGSRPLVINFGSCS